MFYYGYESIFAVPVEYILIFGGTDINQFHEDDNKLTLMTRAVKAARLLWIWVS